MMARKITPTIRATWYSDFHTMMPKVHRMNAMAKYWPNGQNGTLYSRSRTSWRDRLRREATWARRIISQTNTVAKVAREATISKMRSGSSALSTAPMTMTDSRMATVITGTPRDVRAMTFGARFWRARPVSTRPAPKRSALMADSAAVMTTRLSRPAAQLTPRVEKICTNGDWSPVMLRHGLMSRMTRMDST